MDSLSLPISVLFVYCDCLLRYDQGDFLVPFSLKTQVKNLFVFISLLSLSSGNGKHFSQGLPSSVFHPDP